MLTSSIRNLSDYNLNLNLAPPAPAPPAPAPLDLSCQDVSGAPGHVRVVAHQPAALVAGWRDHGRAEVVAAGWMLVVERDVDDGGGGIRIVDAGSNLPLAGFQPGYGARYRRPRGSGGGHRDGRRGWSRRPGRVQLADGTMLRWICPTRSAFECGFVTDSRNFVRFAYDGTAIICTGRASSTGLADATPEIVALVVLGWFLLLEAGRVLTDADLTAAVDELAAVPAYAGLPGEAAAHDSDTATVVPFPLGPAARRRTARRSSHDELAS